MGIQRLSTKGAVNEAIEKRINLAKQSIYRVLMRVGEECVNYARTNGGYLDQTGNLRSSIGYAVVDNGKIISSKGFEQIREGVEGAKTGKDFLNEIIAKHGTGISLIVVAGMNYAAYVESRGYDVISGSELEAEKLTPQLLRQLGFNLNAA